MNREWSELNKLMQQQLKKSTLGDGINTLIKLRSALMDEMISWRSSLDKSGYSAIPFINADGYHSKTVAYSLWHIFRIEDIVVNTLIRNEEQVFDKGGFRAKTNSPIATTGNELVGTEISDFSEKLDIDGLYSYISAVRNATDSWIKSVDYSELGRKFTAEDRQRVIDSGSVSTDGSASWLIDYWCGKDVKGLIKMPLSRHWIMHIEASLRIIAKIR